MALSKSRKDLLNEIEKVLDKLEPVHKRIKNSTLKRMVGAFIDQLVDDLNDLAIDAEDN